MHSKKRQSYRQVVNCDLELRPLMNVFIVLIPMLLMSAVFMEIRVIEMTLPQTAEAAEPTPPVEPFDVAIRILPDSYVVGTNGTVVRTVPRDAGASGSAVDAGATELARALADIVAAHPDNKGVRIVADASTHYREIVTVMDIARAAGLPQAALEGAEIAGM